MRFSLVRLSALAGGVALVMSCDGGPVSTKFGNGIAGGTSGTAPVTPPPPGSVDSNKPFVRIDTPVALPQQLINAGDSILVVIRAIDDRKVKTVTVRGLQYKGTASLGTLQEIERYPAISAPVGGANFRPGLTDTIIRRKLVPASPVDTSVDSLVIQAIVVDSSNNADTTRRVVQLVNGPRVSISAPIPNDSVPKGIAMAVTVTATHPSGVDTVEVHVTGDPATFTASTALLDTTVAVATGGGTTVTRTININIPLLSPSRGKITINARARDANRNQGNAPPVLVFARAARTVAPRVYQTVPAKLEYLDSITVSATADGVASIGRLIRDAATNVVIDSFEVAIPAPIIANQTVRLPLNLTIANQGQRLTIVSWARDTAGVRGWSLAAGVGIPDTVRSLAFKDTTFITYGITYPFPGSRPGVAGDIAVDTSAGNVFVSNTKYNIVEIWNNTSKTFSASGVQVGAQPWGLFTTYGATKRLLVANSGSTTISRVDMAASPPAEVLTERLRTTNISVYEVLFTINSSGFLVLDWDGNMNQYSDRPQYVAQSEGGRIFYSTKPTGAKTPGTIRFLNPSLPIPDPRQIWTYGRRTTTSEERYLLFNADSIAVHKTAAGTSSFSPDTLVVCDHPFGGRHGTVPPLYPVGTVDGLGNPVNDTRVDDDDTPFCVKAVSRANVVDSVRKYGGDVEMVANMTLTTLSLTDTTFVAASGDGKWIAFGEGNAAKTVGSGVNRSTPTARVILSKDEALPSPNNLQPQFYSPALTVDDIQENASDKLFGLALGATGLQLIGHTDQTFVAAVNDPTLVTTGIFHLRLDGLYESFANGGGVAFHPLAMGTTTASAANRVAFTATTTGYIEAFDVAHYNNRGTYITKGNLYGPLRVTLPLDAADVAKGIVLKLYGLTEKGLIVIDLRAADIK